MSGSNDDAVASGVGKIVRNPWIVSNANRIGMCSRELLDRVVLVLVDQDRIGLREHAADRLARLLRVLLHLAVGEQRQLIELLLQGHPPQQALHPALDAVITSRPLHLQRGLVTRA